MKFFKTYLLFLCTVPFYAQNIPAKKVIEISELQNYLTAEVKKNIDVNNKITTEKLALYFREKFAERYFYNYTTVNDRFKEYSELYPSAKNKHTENGLDHLQKYPANTVWKLPFNYKNGETVNAYALRHLARQHKMVDIAFSYFYQQKDTQYVDYFTQQISSLNTALHQNKFETIEDGNGVYEAFRSGYRVLNWLQIHNLFLVEKAYSDQEQLTTIATLLQHGSYLFETNKEFHSGNHQTRGLSALAMISILLRDFVDTDLWYKHSMQLLEEHLRKEINKDGFQFERSVHYHMSDIGNYFYVYQLAKNSNLKVDDFWKNKLESLFTTLTKIAFPDKSAPVFSDDTDEPWAEKNDISQVLTLGYLLFENKSFGYFANNKVSEKMYWYTSKKQLENLQNIQQETPKFNSTSFPETGYYIMRKGWQKNDNMLVVSAGLDAEKPDHQHGDILGIQVFANENVVLPNYQVRYSLNDLELFKNSMTKNVALVDDQLQGKKYTSNKGGSGFGKFLQLPNPKVIAFQKDTEVEVFIASHDGFENVGVNYTRQIINVDNDFWIVKDNFSSDKKHNYKQVWQGHYTKEKSTNLLRASFQNGTGLDIYQLHKIDTVFTDGTRGKQWNVVTKNEEKDFNFITILHPFSKYDNRIEETKESPTIKGWQVNASNFKTDALKTISKNGKVFLFGVQKITLKNTVLELSEKADIFIEVTADKIKLQSLFYKTCTIISTDKNSITEKTTLNPLDIFIN